MKRKILSVLLSVFAMFPLFSAYASADEPNKAPTVIPAIREWSGRTGKFVVKNATITLSGNISEAKKTIIAEAFEDYLGITASFVSGNADMDLVDTAADSILGDDGYKMTVTSEKITVSAPEELGLLYGVYTVLQSLKADGFVPCGTAKDYSYYQIRGGMIDVARAYVPLEMLEEITKYFSFYKMNEIHVHINDVGDNGYFIFRLESDVEGLTATDGYYTKDAYRAYQKNMLNYGVEVITEIDTPAHSACFQKVRPDLMLDTKHLDITKPETLEFVKALFDEYITGDDPVFVSKRVHIGTDEYPDNNEGMRAYTDALLKHVKSRGYIPRFWGGFGNDGFNGTTPVTGDAETNFWAVSLSDYNTLIDMGYDIINTVGPVLYIVPGGNYGFADYYDVEKLYSSWYVNYMGTTASTAIDPDHKQLLGANFAIWNDLHTEWSGFSHYDIFDRIRSAVCLISEKTWCGEQTRSISAKDFANRVELLSDYAATGDPGKHSVDKIEDSVPEGVTGFGFPYIASADVTINSLGDSGFKLFSGLDGELYIDKNGKIGFKRDVYNYNFTFDGCVLEEGKTYNIKLIAGEKKTVLCIDNTYYYHPTNQKNLNLTRSSTFTLPLENIGEGLNGKVENLTVTRERFDLNSLLATVNHALNRPATVSGLEVDDGRFTQDLAFDGDYTTRVSFSAKADYQWMVVDLESVKTVNRVLVHFNENIKDYKISVSEDGVNYTEVAHVTCETDMQKITDTVEFPSTKARYIKYEQFKRFYVADWSTYYSGGILEFEVYGFEEKVYNNLLAEAEKIIENYPKDSESIRNAEKKLRRYLKGEFVYTGHLDALAQSLRAEIESFSPPTAESEADISSEAPINEEPQTNTLWIWVGIASAVLAALIAAIIFVLLKKSR